MGCEKPLVKTIPSFDVFSLGHSTAFFKYDLTSLNLLKTEANKVLEEVFCDETFFKKKNWLLHFSFCSILTWALLSYIL